MRSENESPSNTKANEHHPGGMDRRQGKGAGWRTENGGDGGGGVGGQIVPRGWNIVLRSPFGSSVYMPYLGSILLKPFSSGTVHANKSSLQQRILQTQNEMDAIAKRIRDMTNEFPADTDGLEDSWKQLKRKLTEMQQTTNIFVQQNLLYTHP